MPEPNAGDRIRHRGLEGLVVFRQAIPGMVHVGKRSCRSDSVTS